MLFLILGIIIWSAEHFIPVTAPGFRSKLIDRFGTARYKTGFGIITLAAVALIIWGWQNASANLLYLPPTWGAFFTIFLTLIAFVLIFAPYIDNNYRRMIRQIAVGWCRLLHHLYVYSRIVVRCGSSALFF